MNESAEQFKNTVEDWIKITKANYQDVIESEKAKEPRLSWIFSIDKKIFIYMMKERPDRINFDCPINLAEEHQTATSKLPDHEFLQFLIDITEPMLIVGLAPRYQQEEKRIKQITIGSYVDTGSLEREKFYRVWDKISSFRELTIKKIQTKFGVKGKLNISSSGGSDNSIYG